MRRLRGRRATRPRGWVTSGRCSECPETGARHQRPGGTGPCTAGRSSRAWRTVLGLEAASGARAPAAEPPAPSCGRSPPGAGGSRAFEVGEVSAAGRRTRAVRVGRHGEHGSSRCPCAAVASKAKRTAAETDSAVSTCSVEGGGEGLRDAPLRPSSPRLTPCGGWGSGRPGNSKRLLLLNTLSRRRSYFTQLLKIF